MLLVYRALFGERLELPEWPRLQSPNKYPSSNTFSRSNLILRRHTMASTETKTKTFKSHPIESWDDGMSPIYTHLHPLLLLGLFYYQFPSLVEKPIDTLPQTALGVAALQLLYLCICIPGSNQAQLPQRGKKKGKMTQNHQGDTGIGAKLVVSVAQLCQPKDS